MTRGAEGSGATNSSALFVANTSTTYQNFTCTKNHDKCRIRISLCRYQQSNLSFKMILIITIQESWFSSHHRKHSQAN